ncbi:MAG: hypothetical protein ACYC2K_18505 [Gemmatimonadales bacterium]
MLVLLTVLSLSLAASRPEPPVVLGDTIPGLAGSWRFDPDRSERPGDQLDRRGRGGLRPGAGGVRGRFGGREGRSPEEASEMLEQLRAPQQLAIDLADSTVSIGADLRPAEVIRLDGRRATVDTVGTVVTRITARWKDGRLDVERKTGRMTVKERYGIDPVSGLLTVDLIAEGGMRKLEWRRIYQPAQPR